MTFADLARLACRRFIAAGIPDAEAHLDAERLARHVLGWDRARWITHRDDEAPEPFAAAYEPCVRRRVRREPTPHIVGEHEFWGLAFEVGPAVLTPRPETELIIEEAICRAAKRPPGLVVDIGTGSGCLAVVLARVWPEARVVATDVSAAALAVARRNAVRHGVGDRLRFRHGSGFAGLAEPVDLVVSNPPYVRLADAHGLPPEVRDHEPPMALYGPDEDGLGAYREIFDAARGHVAPGGWLIVEMGLGQAAAVRALVDDRPWLDWLAVRNDLQGIERVATLSLSGGQGNG